jgi:phenylpropionate dioxygenase-like ring-hydroxylating dioxygenase large terminal subunit
MRTGAVMQERRNAMNEIDPIEAKSFSGYRGVAATGTDADLVKVGRGTPGGEYLRRFWHPIAYLTELTDVPLRARILGEDLVIFRDGGGAIGVLHLNCCHRGASLEFGIVAEKGIRCCYHGRVFDTDGAILEMPGEPHADRLRQTQRQPAYPTHVFAGMVFVYMGPPEKQPPFPVYDRFDLPGVKLVPSMRQPFACNWVQIKDNAADPAHTAVLHAIKGANQFSDEFGHFPELTFVETPVGLSYFAARRVGENIWVRSNDVIMPNIHSLPSIIEDGRDRKPCSPPWLTIWTVPVDDENSINFLLSHVSEDDPTTPERRRYLESFGQQPNRPYAERQRIPGDYDAMVSQGAITDHRRENLGTLDQGIVLFRRRLRREIEAVQRGEDPPSVMRGAERIATYGVDRVVPVSTLKGEADDPEARRGFARALADEYLRKPPLRDFAPRR